MPRPSCDRVADADHHVQGALGRYLAAVTDQWLAVAPDANPGMLDILRDRDRRPYRDMVPWAGEFAGKYLTAAVQAVRLTNDPKLRGVIEAFVDELASLQDDSGYLGPWPQGHHLTGTAPNNEGGIATWDAWGHYHVMLGLLLWHEDTGSTQALECARAIGDLLVEKFLGDVPQRLVDTGSTEMNLAPVHSLCLLHTCTGDSRYLDLALQIVDEFAATNADGAPLAGDYLNTGVNGVEFFETPKPRWESLHPIMGLVELYYITGDARYRDAFESHWWSIVKLDRHNNGGFSSGEQAQGNPYHPGAIETCCTIAWTAMSVEMLRLTGDSIVADELELSTINSIVGLHSASGRWATYNTPMNGVRRASAHDIVFQSREGTPELNCCSVNAARGLGMVSDWAIMQDDDDLHLNWYGPCVLRAAVGDGRVVTLEQRTDYPRSGGVTIHVTASAPVEFDLRLRIPHWSERTSVTVNGDPVQGVSRGEYCAVSRTWRSGDVVELTLDMSLHFWAGERECEGLTSVYRGPVLLTYDRRLNDMDPDDIPALDASDMGGRICDGAGRLRPEVLVEFTAADGRAVRLCDFGSAGEGGSPYRSWLEIGGVAPVEFTRDSPLRTTRVG
jgi:DUF1680 family protein